VIELPLSFQSGALTLPGTLTMPANYSARFAGRADRSRLRPYGQKWKLDRSAARQNNSNLYAILAWAAGGCRYRIRSLRQRALGENLQKINLAETSNR